MNYKKIYDNIIEYRLKNIPINCYIENHHILPKSLGGDDNQNNIVKLTGREHFICHYLLTKIYKKDSIEYYKMLCAFMMMKCSKLNKNRYFNSRLYERLKIDFGKYISEINSIYQKGINNSQYGTIWICNIDEKINKKVPKDTIINYPWIKGRNVWKKINSDNIKNKRKNDLYIKRKKEAEKYWKMYIDSDASSLHDFCKKGYYTKTVKSLSRLFRKYITEYTENSKMWISYKKSKVS